MVGSWLTAIQQKLQRFTLNNKATTQGRCVRKWALCGTSRITNTRLVNSLGNSISSVQPGEPVLIEFDFAAGQPLKNATGWLHLARDGHRIFDTDTGNLGTDLGTLSGTGTLRCRLPNIPLMPNVYDIQVGILDEHGELQSSAWCPAMLSILRHESTSEMGCGWIPEASDRGIVYGRAAWSVLHDENAPVLAVAENPPLDHKLSNVRRRAGA